MSTFFCRKCGTRVVKAELQQCPDCGADLPGRGGPAVSPPASVAGRGATTKDARRRKPAPRTHRGAPPPLPPGIDLSTDEDGLHIVVTWARKMGLTMGLLALILVGTFGNTLYWIRNEADIVPWVLLIAVPVVSWAIWTALLFSFNKTTVTVAHGKLKVGVGPLPWFGGFRVSLDQVEGFDAITRAGKSYLDHEIGEVEETPDRFEVSTRLTGGKQRTIAVNLFDPAQADYVVTMLEEYLAAGS